jgi:rhodanese-related sulfurtransferase
MANLSLMSHYGWPIGDTKSGSCVLSHGLGESIRYHSGDVNPGEIGYPVMGVLRKSDTLGGMKKTRILPVLVGLTLVASPVLASCGGSSTSSDDTTTVISLVPAGKVIDVRTPEEFSEGYVKGAVNIDVSDPDFESQIASLDKDVAYSVYCRSGNRSAVAVDIMRNAGFTNVVDLGAVEEAAQALSLPVVTD